MDAEIKQQVEGLVEIIMSVAKMDENNYMSYLEDLTQQFMSENNLAELDLEQLQSMSDDELYEWAMQMGIDASLF